MDPESLHKSGGRRGRCLEVFLVVSIMFLFVALAAVAVGGVIVVKELRDKLEPPQTSEFEGSPLKNPAYKIQNFVYLAATQSTLQTGTMLLAQDSFLPGRSLESNFLFDLDQSSLKPKQAGTYFIYIDLNVTCTGHCKQGHLSVTVGDKLTCQVELPANKTHVMDKCWTVSQLGRQRMLTQMTLKGEQLGDWKLELRGSGVGLFLVD